MKRLASLTALALSAAAMATDFVEAEPNELKAQANLFTIAAGDALVGNSTGASSAAGATSVDTYLVNTAAATLGIYQYRLVITAAIAGHTGTVRGLNQINGVIQTTDVLAQSSSVSTTPARYVQWYGFGKQEQLYYRVSGGSTTTADYRATLERTPISPTDIGNVFAGSLTFTTANQGHATDTELWLYDANLDAIVGGGNDDEFLSIDRASKLTRTLAPGTYYMALSTYNLANNLASPADDEFRDGNVLDFPNAILDHQISANQNVAFAIVDLGGTHAYAATKTNPFDIVWIKFTVVPPSPTIVLHDNTGVLPSPGSVLSGTDAAVNASDEVHWELRPGLVFSNTQDPCRFELVGHAPGAAPSLLEVFIESRANTGSVRQTIQAYDYVGITFVTVGTPADLPFGASPDGLTTVPLAPATFIKPSSIPANEMRMRVSFRAMSVVFSYPWKVKIDWAAWRYTF